MFSSTLSRNSKLIYSVSASNSIRFFSSNGKKIAFIGLGNMGKHMAMNLLKNGYSVSVFDVNTAAVEDLKKAGAKSASRVEDLVPENEIVITMLPSNDVVKNVLTSMFSKAKEGTMFIDSSTISPNVVKELAQTASSKKLKLVDAPVSGGVMGAEKATLTFMVGAGSESDFKDATSVLEKMGTKFVHVGDTGSGQVAKLCNNLILATTMAGLAEAMNLGVQMGLDATVLGNIINGSSGRSWSSEIYNPVPNVIPTSPASRGYVGGFGMPLMVKDCTLGLDCAKSINVKMPVTDEVLATYQKAMAKGFNGLDFSAIYAYLADKDPKNPLK